MTEQSDQTEQFDPGSERSDIDRDIGCATGSIVTVMDMNHRHWRFRRDPLGRTLPVAIQHHITGHQQPDGGELR